MSGSRPKHAKPARKPLTIDAEGVAVEPETGAGGSNDAAPQAEPVAFGRDAMPAGDDAVPAGPGAGIDDTSSAHDARSEAAPASRTAPRRGGFVAGGLAGAAAGAAVAAVLGFLGGGNAPTPVVDDSLAARIAALETRADAPATGAGLDASPLLAEIDALKAGLAGRDGAVADLAARVDALAAMPAGEGAGGDIAAVSALSARIDALQPEIDVLKQGLAGSGEAAADVAALEGELGTARAALDEAVERIAALEGAVATLKGEVEAAGNDAGLAGVVAASALRAAIDRGGPFAAELETFAALGLAPQTVEALKAQAGRGVKTREQLMAGFEDAAQAMLAAADPAPATDGVIGSLIASARGLVKVRPVGEVEGEGPDAGIARMGAALTRGDDAAALAEFEALPDAVKAAGAAFAAELAARIETDRLVAEAIAAAGRPSDR